MRKIFRTYLSVLFFSAVCTVIISCYVPNEEKDTEKNIQNLLLLALSQNSGTITCLEAGEQKSYNSYAKGIYTIALPGTIIGGNSDTIANRFIQISIYDTNKIPRSYDSTIDTIYIDIFVNGTPAWTTNMLGGDAKITISKYGPVGDTIEGIFEGRLIYTDGTPLDITDGQFAVRRHADE